MQPLLLLKSAELHQAYKTQDRLTGLGRSIKVFVIGEIEQLNTKWKEFRKRVDDCISYIEDSVENGLFHCSYALNHKLNLARHFSFLQMISVKNC